LLFQNIELILYLRTSLPIHGTVPSKIFPRGGRGMSEVLNSYGDDSIKSLKGAERIRKRPAAVLGSDGLAGAFHTVTEIIGNSMDEVRAGYGDLVSVVYHKDGSLTVEDTGRGVPMAWNEGEGLWNWHLIFNELYAGGKYDDDNPNYEFSLGLNGLGAASTQYSSAFFNVVSKRHDKIFKKSFIEGNPINVTEDGAPEEEPNTTGVTGTSVHWKADDKVFTNTAFTATMFKNALESQAHLNKVKVTFTDENTGEHIEYVGRGIVEYLREKLGTTVIDIIEKSAEKSGVENGKKYKSKIEVVLAITEGGNSVYLHHHNTSKMKVGVHQGAFDNAVTAFFRTVAKQNNVVILPYDYNEYLSVLTSSFANANSTSFANQTKEGVDNQFIYDLVYTTVLDMLEEALAKQKPSVATLVDNVVNSALARKAAKEYEAQQKLALKAMGKKRETPEKFVDCKTKDKSIKEVYIVEGDSALGSCKKARDAVFQALLPVKGKPLNCLKANLDVILKNEEVKAIINTVGTGIDIGDGSDLFDLKGLDWDKIIIATDADVDGLQIRALLFTLFMRLMPKLLELGYVYVAETPLFEITTSEGTKFAYSAEERRQIVADCSARGVRISQTQRSKGLGQNDAPMLSVSTMKPETRRLVQLKIDTKNPNVLSISNMLFGIDPGKERKAFITGMLEQSMGFETGFGDLIDSLAELENLEAVDIDSDIETVI
jgi:DNA gyrase subunit B